LSALTLITTYPLLGTLTVSFFTGLLRFIIGAMELAPLVEYGLWLPHPFSER
jgi:hypothetical protein